MTAHCVDQGCTSLRTGADTQEVLSRCCLALLRYWSERKQRVRASQTPRLAAALDTHLLMKSLLASCHSKLRPLWSQRSHSKEVWKISPGTMPTSQAVRPAARAERQGKMGSKKGLGPCLGVEAVTVIYWSPKRRKMTHAVKPKR